MFKKLFLVLLAWTLIVGQVSSGALAADAKVTALPALAAPSADDLVYCVDDPAGTPISSKCRVDAIVGSVPLVITNMPKVDILLAPTHCLDAGANDTYACNLSPAITAYVTGTTYWFKANTANTLAATVNFNTVGAVTIKQTAGGITTDLATNDIRAGMWVQVTYDGTNMQCGNCSGNPTTVVAPGSDTQCIFNDVAAFGADAGCTYNKTTDILTLLGGLVNGNCATNCLTLDSSAITGTKTQVFLNVADTFVYLVTAQVLTNKDMTSATNTFPTRVYWDGGSIVSDGTNCADATKQTLNSGPILFTFSCADSNSSIFYGQTTLPSAVATVTFKLDLFHAASESITFAGDFSAQCRATTTVINSTWGTAVAADVALTTTANQTASATTSAVTPNGTCSAGATLFWRYVVDAANFSTNAANSKVLGVYMAKAS